VLAAWRTGGFPRLDSFTRHDYNLKGLQGKAPSILS
jgi:hypothetical protein